MRINQSVLVVVMLMPALVIVACTGQGRVSQPTADQANLEQTCPTLTADSQGIDVDALIREKLDNHHGIEKIYNARHTREEWNATLDRMISFGAKISETEKQIIIDNLLCIQQ